MANIIQIVLYSFASGVTVILGGFLAKLKVLPNNEVGREISHGIVAFGGGVLIAAVAFVLTPQAIKLLSLPLLIGVFLLGVICFFILDRSIALRGGKLAQLMAMMMDFIPEALALGAVFASNSRSGLLLALFIGMQNLPEAYNAFEDLLNSGYSPNKSLCILIPFSLIGVVAAVCGYRFLSGNDQFIASLMLFSAGGILYLVFQDIAPMAKLRNHWTPATGATLGFMLGMIGEKVLGA